MQTVSFIHHSPADGGVRMICRETGEPYCADVVGREWMIHRGDFEPLGFRACRVDMLSLIEQTARLDFLCAQADCGQSAVDTYWTL